MQVHDCEQRSEEWFKVRLGMPTASEFACVMRTKGRGENGESKQRTDYLYKLAGEQISGVPMESYTNQYMERGRTMEEEIRKWYAFAHDTADITQVGFISLDCRIGKAGCSPDALVNTNGIVEIKTMAPHLLLQLLDKPSDYVPPEHMAQCQGNLWITGREYCDLVISYTGMKRFARRIMRDRAYCAEIEAAVCRFNHELAQLVARHAGKAA